MFTHAEWYDQSINWATRFQCEIPVLVHVLGPPGGGLLDAGCGSGRQVCALAKRGYHVVGVDASEEMLAVARRTAARDSIKAQFTAPT